GELDALVPSAAARLDPLVVVVDRHGQGLLGLVLPDHVRVEELVDLPGFRQVVPLEVGGLGELFLDDLVTQIDALVADIHARTRDELLDLLLAFATERALEQVTTVADACHPVSFAWGRSPSKARGEGACAEALDVVSTLPPGGQ